MEWWRWYNFGLYIALCVVFMYVSYKNRENGLVLLLAFIGFIAINLIFLGNGVYILK